jgi:hypothetical protein
VTKLFALDEPKKIAGCIVLAENELGTRSIGIAYFVPDPALLERLAATPVGSTIKVRSKPAEKGSPCAMELVEFVVVAGGGLAIL